MVSQGGAVDGPPPRHRHSAVLHNNAMWIFGGMTDLQERADFWRFDFGECSVRCKISIVSNKKRKSISMSGLKWLYIIFYSVSKMATCEV